MSRELENYGGGGGVIHNRSVRNVTPEFISHIHKTDDSCRKLRYLIVLPRIAYNNQNVYMFPIGIAYVSAAMKAAGRDVYTLNLNYKNESDKQAVSRTVRENCIDVVLSGGLTEQYVQLKGIFDAAKQEKPVITICGGGIITSDPEAAMAALETVDYGIIGEGEISSNELAYALETDADISNVLSIVYKNKNGLFMRTPERPEISNLDMLPWPDYEGLEYGETLSKNGMTATYTNKGTANVALGRSCPFNCSFCFHPTGRRYRQRSFDSFFAELDYLREHYDFNSLMINDEMFNKNLPYVEEFCKRIKPYGLKWWCQIHARNVTREMVATLANGGCSAATVGLESADPIVLKSMNKQVTLSEIENVLNFCLEFGIHAQANLIFGDSAETVETYRNSLKWRDEHLDFDIQLAWIKIFPGTKLYKIALQCGIIKDRVQFIKDGCPQINVTSMSDDEYKKMTLEYELHDAYSQCKYLKEVRVHSANNNGYLSVSGICPACGASVDFEMFYPFEQTRAFICSTCFRPTTIDFVNYNLHRFCDSLSSMAETGGLAIWGIKAHLVKALRENLPSETIDKITFIDKSIAKLRFGREMFGVEIYPPQILTERLPDTVLVATAGLSAQDILRTVRESYPSVKEIGFLVDLLY